MDLIKLLRSFEEFLFEVVTWLFFYPTTLFRICVRPIAMMDYAVTEEDRPVEHRYDEAINPPLLLLITLVLVNAIGWALHIPPSTGGSSLIKLLYSSQQNLLLFRCLVFSLAPLILALAELRKRGEQVSRETLRRPFYAQSFIAAPFALMVSLGLDGLTRPSSPRLQLIGGALIAAALVWLVVVEARWFVRRLHVSLAKATWIAAAALARTLAYVFAMMLFIGLV